MLETEKCNENVIANSSGDVNVHEAQLQNSPSHVLEDLDDSDWEDGAAGTMDGTGSYPMTIEFSETQHDSIRRKPIRRASAADKVSFLSLLLLALYLILLQILYVS